jgi:hypothetical protein
MTAVATASGNRRANLPADQITPPSRSRLQLLLCHLPLLDQITPPTSALAAATTRP